MTFISALTSLHGVVLGCARTQTRVFERLLLSCDPPLFSDVCFECNIKARLGKHICILITDLDCSYAR